MDPGYKDVMNRKPRDPKESFFAEGAGMRAIVGGVLIGILTLVAFYLGIIHLININGFYSAYFLSIILFIINEK